MITIHHLTRSRSERIVWLMEELGLEYQVQFFRREPNGAAPAAMRDIHPIGKAPIVTDGETVLAESGAIVEYIVRRHGGGRLAVPPDSPDYPRYIYWLHFAEGSLMTLMLINLVLSRVPEAAESAVKARQLDRLAKMLAFVDGELAGRSHFAGDFSAADIMMVFPFTTLRHFFDYDFSPYANIDGYLRRIAERPAYQRAMAKAGPDA